MSSLGTWDAVELYLQSLDLDKAEPSLDVLAAVVHTVSGHWVVTVFAPRGARTCARGGAADLHRVDASQHSYGDGPSAVALAAGKPVLVGDLARHRSAWPSFAQGALAAGARSLAAVPMAAAGTVAGVVTLYSPQPHEWTSRELAPVRVVAELAALADVAQTNYRRQAAISDQLRGALDSRVVIEQAKGALAFREGITVQEAFERMRRLARRRSISVHDVAATVLAERSSPQVARHVVH